MFYLIFYCNFRSNFPLKKVCYDKTEHLNGLQDARLSSSNLGQNHKQFKPPTPQPPAPDPYAFSDESSNTPATISRGSMRNSRDDMFQRPSPFKVNCFIYHWLQIIQWTLMFDDGPHLCHLTWYCTIGCSTQHFSYDITKNGYGLSQMVLLDMFF